MKKVTVLKIISFLFILNSISFFLYFSSSSNSNHQNHFIRSSEKAHLFHPPEKHHQARTNFPNKQWPILPSYLPWSQNPNVPTFRSCEAYFGNGFTRKIDLFSPENGRKGGWFRCFYSETLRSSVCEGGRIRMVSGKIRVSKGGERLEEVSGRDEEDELPVFEPGAFELDGGNAVADKLVGKNVLDEYVPQGEISMHTMRGLIDSIRVVKDHQFQCELWVEEPTLLVTRFEYANLFHTVTDWYSAYVASKVTGLPNRPHLIFVDGHCKTPLDETWKALFSSLRFAKNFSGSVCFRHAVLVPLGYETALFKGLSEDVKCNGASAHELWQNPDDRKTARLLEFGEMIRTSFGFRVNRDRAKKSSSAYNVLFVRREDYLAHPRHGGKVQSRLSNEAEIFDSLQKWASNHTVCNINLVNGLFAHMPMKEQVRAIQKADVIIGAHGAGLTHIVSAKPGTSILEIISSEYRRPHFQLISQWKGLEYYPIYLAGSYADSAVVLDKLSNIMTSIGC